ncbi:MAG: dihydropteroate synthase [Succinivibrio sp.]|nr:dihydropteroate synthase [Succinivibrio sp.]
MQLSSRGRTLDLSTPAIMGIVNVTPDSFSDGGHYLNAAAAYEHAARLTQEGATIIDIGGESTRPDSQSVSEAEELDRVLPVIEKVARNLDIMISLDTSKSAVMRAGIEAGAHLINDINALRSPHALDVCLSLDCAVILMHMQGTPQNMQHHPHYTEVVSEVKQFFKELCADYLKAGLKPEHMLLDPGFGFGKTVQDNYTLLCRLSEFKSLGYPLVTGLSRKSMIGAVCHRSAPQERLYGSLAGALICAQKGASILRVHDVMATQQALAVLKACNEAEARS